MHHTSGNVERLLKKKARDVPS